MYDVIVVGARCAGSSLAMLLCSRGYKVLLVDRNRFPSDTISTHWIQETGLERLRRWGLLERIVATGPQPIRKVTFDMGRFVLSGLAPGIEGIPGPLAPRRTILDQILVEAAVQSGAELREGFMVEDLLHEGDRIVGIKGHDSGATAREKATIVVGADGVSSLVARKVDAPAYNEIPTLIAFYYSYWSGVENRGIEMYPRERRGIGLIPTNDGLTLAGVAWPHSEFRSVRSNLEENLWEGFQMVGGLEERLRAGDRAERIVGTASQPNFFRRPYGPGWALVGDAGYNRDAITAQGISDAFRDAELLAGALDQAFRGEAPMADALVGYATKRDQAMKPMYDFTCELAKLEPPPPEMAALFEAISNDRDATSRFLGMFAGTVGVEEFMAPENLASIMQLSPA
jgi:flavin-dependent dehydrogenase